MTWFSLVLMQNSSFKSDTLTTSFLPCQEISLRWLSVKAVMVSRDKLIPVTWSGHWGVQPRGGSWPGGGVTTTRAWLHKAVPASRARPKNEQTWTVTQRTQFLWRKSEILRPWYVEVARLKNSLKSCHQNWRQTSTNSVMVFTFLPSS